MDAAVGASATVLGGSSHVPHQLVRYGDTFAADVGKDGNVRVRNILVPPILQLFERGCTVPGFYLALKIPSLARPEPYTLAAKGRLSEYSLWNTSADDDGRPFTTPKTTREIDAEVRLSSYEVDVDAERVRVTDAAQPSFELIISLKKLRI